MTRRLSSPSQRLQTFLLVVAVLCFLSEQQFAAAKSCPTRTASLKSKVAPNDALPQEVIVRNGLWNPIQIYWIDTEGNEKFMEELAYSKNSAEYKTETYVGHSWRIYTKVVGDDDDNRILLEEFTMKEKQDDGSIKSKSVHTIDEFCDEAREAVWEQLDQEMKQLVHDQDAPCLPQEESNKWSCIHKLSKEEYEKRLETFGNGIKYGFNNTDESQTREVGATIDTVFAGQIPKIPRLTSKEGPGYLKLNFTNKMKDVLMPWYALHKKGGPQDAVLRHRVIPGGFTNSHTVPMSILNLDFYPNLKSQVVEEMHRVLEWWTQGRYNLVPTSTFGIRIYHRDSMLINHVDRSDTHLASAVIQLGQEGIDEGWPLEVISNKDGSCAEVYMQPGEMVLYEGARFAHGRPMRLNGTDFANVFSHFRPRDWHGPYKSPNYDGLLDEDGYRPQDDGRATATTTQEEEETTAEDEL